MGLDTRVDAPRDSLGRAFKAVKFLDDVEERLTLDMLDKMRGGAVPVAVVFKTPGGSVEVMARGELISSVRDGIEIMDVAKAKLVTLMVAQGVRRA